MNSFGTEGRRHLLELCPDFDENFKLKDGRTEAVPHPQFGFNCHQAGHIKLCPDFDENFKLKDGRTKAVPHPQFGFNCYHFMWSPLL